HLLLPPQIAVQPELKRERWDRHGSGGAAAQPPHTRAAVSTTSSSLAHCWSSVSTLPPATLAKPHWVERASWSRGRTREASSMRRTRFSWSSSSALLEETRPRTAVLPLGTNRSGWKSPARSLSYSRKNTS